VHRMIKKRLCLGDFGHVAAIHDGNPISQLGHITKVMRN
jgi:hypothetical protein